MATLEELQRRAAGPPNPETLTAPTLESLRSRLDVGEPSETPVIDQPGAGDKTQGVLDVLRREVMGDLPEGQPAEPVTTPPSVTPETTPERPTFRGPTTTGGRRRQLLEEMGVPIAPGVPPPRQQRTREESLELAKSASKAIPRGAIESAATGLSPLALGQRLTTARIRALIPEIQGAAGLDETTFNGLVSGIMETPEFSTPRRGFIAGVAFDVRHGDVQPADVPDLLAQVEFDFAGRAQTAMREFAEETFPIPPEHEERLPVQVGRGVGSTGVFLTARVLTGIPGLAVTAAALGSGEAVENAIAAGASDAEQSRAALLGIAPGLTDMLPIERLLKPIKRIPGMEGGLFAIARKAIEQGVIEGTQEAVQQFMQNAISVVTHTPEKELTEGIRENGLVGFLVGALFGAAAGGIQAVRQPAPGETLTDGDDGGASQAGLRADTAPPGVEIDPDTGVPVAAPEAPAAVGAVPGGPGPETPTPTSEPPAPAVRSAGTDLEPITATALSTMSRPNLLNLAERLGFDDVRIGQKKTFPDIRTRLIRELGLAGRKDINEIFDDAGLTRARLASMQEAYERGVDKARNKEPRPVGAPVVLETAALEARAIALYRQGARSGHNEPFTGEGRKELGNIVGELASRKARTGGEIAKDLRERSERPVSEPASQAPIEGEGVVVTPRGRRVETRFEVVDADSITTSHDADMAVNPAFPAELQPRERTRAASTDQVRDIAANFTPELLGQSVSASEGAPIVGPDGIVESGNARTLALRQAYRRRLPSGQRYRDWLTSQGYDTAGIKNPILIRRRLTNLSPEDRIAFVREANERTTLDQSASERARTDAENITPQLLDAYRGGDVTALGNRDFVRSFVDTLAASERAAVLTANGELSQEGAQRIRNALFAKAYGEPEIIAALREDRDTNFKAIGEAMTDVAATWGQMRAAAASGDMPAALDATSALIEALTTVRRARRKGVSVGAFIRQSDMFGAVSPEATEFLRMMFRDNALSRPASRQRVANALQVYAEEAHRHSTQAGLLPDTTTINDVLQVVRRQIEGGLLDFPPAAEMRAPVGQPTLDNLRTRASATPTAPTLETLRSRVNAEPGGAATGFVRDEVGGVASDTPIRREDILRELAAGLNVPLYQGRIKGKRTLGFFRKPIDEVRIKNFNDIEVAAHEYGHLLDSRYPEIRAQWLPATKANKAFRDELREVSYDRSKLFEGWAEFVRLFMTQREEARARAPKVFAWFEDFVAGNPDGPAIRRAQEQMHAWFAQDAVTRARSKIGVTREINSGLTSIFSRFRQAVTDDFEGIMNMERSLTGEIASVGAYETARLTRGKYAIVEGALLYGPPVEQADGSHKFIGKSLQAILDPVADRLDDFLMYAVGRSAAELHSQGRENLFTVAEIRGMVLLETPEFRTAFEEYQEWNRAMLDFAEAKGVINPASRAAWRRTQYVPFHRVGQGGDFAAVPGDWKGIRALTGGTDNLRDILGNIIGNATALVDVALTNEARLEVVKLARGEGGARFMARIPTEERLIKVHRSEIARAIRDALGIKSIRDLDPDAQAVVDQIETGMEAMVPLLLRGQTPFGRNVVAVLRAGKPEFYEVADPILYRALVAMKRPTRNIVLRFLNTVRRFQQDTITLSLNFLGKNFARDTLMSTIMSRHGFRPLIDSAKGLKSRIASDDNYRDFIANGGGFASYLVDEEALKVHLERFYTSKGLDLKTILDTPRKLLLGLERVADAIEMSARLGEFQRAIGKGESPRHAAFSGREVSTDFAMRGDNEALNYIYDGFIFVKAMVNGIDRYYRGLAQDPNKAQVAAYTGLLALFAMGLYLINRGNPEFEDLPDWERDAFLHFFVPTDAMIRYWNGAGPLPPEGERYLHFRYPTIWEPSIIASTAERTMEGILNEQPAEAADHISRLFLDQFHVDYLPAPVMPLAEVFLSNRDSFTGRPIEPPSVENLPPWMRATPSTSQTARELGEAQRHLPRDMQLSPAKIQALIDGYLNAWGGYGLALSDGLLFDDAPDLPVEQYPGIGVFFRPGPQRQTRFQREFYEMLRNATEARSGAKRLASNWRMTEAEALIQTQAAREYLFLSKRSQAMRTLSSIMGRTRLAPDLETVHELVDVLARIPRLSGEVQKIQASPAWNDIGALKRRIEDMVIIERNRILKESVETVQRQRKGTAK